MDVYACVCMQIFTWTERKISRSSSQTGDSFFFMRPAVPGPTLFPHFALDKRIVEKDSKTLSTDYSCKYQEINVSDEKKKEE
jgi:hypothetical protein